MFTAKLDSFLLVSYVTPMLNQGNLDFFGSGLVRELQLTIETAFQTTSAYPTQPQGPYHQDGVNKPPKPVSPSNEVSVS